MKVPYSRSGRTESKGERETHLEPVDANVVPLVDIRGQVQLLQPAHDELGVGLAVKLCPRDKDAIVGIAEVLFVDGWARGGERSDLESRVAFAAAGVLERLNAHDKLFRLRFFFARTGSRVLSIGRG